MGLVSHFDQVFALAGPLVPQYLAFAAGAAVEVDSGTISVKGSGMMALCLCHGSYLVF